MLNHPLRLSIVAAVAQTDRIDFQALAEDLELTAPVLSKANGQLEEKGYLAVHKGFVGKRPRTWLSLTPQGRKAYQEHVAAPREIAGPG